MKENSLEKAKLRYEKLKAKNDRAAQELIFVTPEIRLSLRPWHFLRKIHETYGTKQNSLGVHMIEDGGSK
jgi:hypothetical protein